MNALRATLAIARREMRPYWLHSVAVRVILGAALGVVLSSDAFYFDRFPWSFIIMAIVAIPLGALAGIEPRVCDLTYFIAPIYGRQLARAQAITVSVAAFAFPTAFYVAAVVAGKSNNYIDDPSMLHSILGWITGSLFFGVASVVASLVGLSATLRGGLTRTAYVIFACLVGYFTFALFVFATNTIYNAYVQEIRDLCAFAIALILGFFALRAFGETLARYDPIP